MELSDYDWKEDPRQGSRGWLVMGNDNVTLYQQPAHGVLLLHSKDEEGVGHWK